MDIQQLNEVILTLREQNRAKLNCISSSVETIFCLHRSNAITLKLPNILYLLYGLPSIICDCVLKPYISTNDVPDTKTEAELLQDTQPPRTEFKDIANQVFAQFKRTITFPWNVEFAYEKKVFVVAGESYPCEPLGNGSFGRLLIFWPSKFQGGGFKLDSKILDYPECDNNHRFNWAAIFGEPEHLPITAGKMTVYSFHIKFGRDNEVNCIAKLNRAKMSVMTAPFRPQMIPYCAKELDGKSFGMLLSSDYMTNKTFSLDMLTGLDRQMVSAFKPYGCSFEIIPVAYCAESDGTNRAVYSLTREDMQRIIGDTVDPIGPKQPLLPFYCISSGAFTPTIEADTDSTDDSRVFLRPALIVRFPNWWTRARLIWIANKKNNPTECPIACLPKDIIKTIIKIICNKNYEEETGDTGK